jgi:hypothetical protein
MGYSESFREQAGVQVPTPNFFVCTRSDVEVEQCVSFSI